MKFVREEGSLLVTVSAAEAAGILGAIGLTHLKSTCPFVSALGLADSEKVVEYSLGMAGQRFPEELRDVLAQSVRVFLEESVGHADPQPGSMREGDGVTIPVTPFLMVSVGRDIQQQLQQVTWKPAVLSVLLNIRGGMFEFTDAEILMGIEEFAEFLGGTFDRERAVAALLEDRAEHEARVDFQGHLDELAEVAPNVQIIVVNDNE